MASKLPALALKELSQDLAGRLVVPSDRDFDDLRRHCNARYPSSPSAIALCSSACDARAAVVFASRHGLPFTIRGGGHGLAGFAVADGALQIDLRQLDWIRVDAHNSEVEAGGGALCDAIWAELGRLDCHVPLVPHPIGIVGFASGGGLGLTARALGLAADHLTGIRLLLADGRFVEASETQNVDLFWALRGGGAASFGIVVSVRFKMLSLLEPKSRRLTWPLADCTDQAAAIAVLCRADAVADDPSLASCDLIGIIDGRPGPDPCDLRIWAASVTGAELRDELLSRLEAGCVLCATGPRPATARAPPRTEPSFSRQGRFISRKLGSAEWHSILRAPLCRPDDRWRLQLILLGSAVTAAACESTAFVHREARWLIALTVLWQEPDEAHAMLALQRQWLQDIAPLTDGSAYVNFANRDLPDFASAYWGKAAPALALVKNKYDPLRVFDFPQAVPSPVGHAAWPPHVISALADPIVAVADCSSIGRA
jgi:FAD/FMN-containing dehydrogenase